MREGPVAVLRQIAAATPAIELTPDEKGTRAPFFRRPAAARPRN